MPDATPLDPHHLTPSASLNRLQIVDLPGVRVDAGVLGKTAYDLVSSEALFAQIQRYGKALKLPPDLLTTPSIETFVAFDRCFEHPARRVRQAAQRIARQYGRNLGYVLLTLRRGDAINRQARPEWDDSYWAYWRDTPALRLGGGLIRGHLRDTLLADLYVVFGEVEMTPPTLALDDYGAYLPLVGVARCAPAGFYGVGVLDFGGTQVKQGMAFCEDGALERLAVIPPLTVPETDSADEMRQFVGDAIALMQRWMSIAGIDTPVIPVSMAAYIDPTGNPYPRPGSLYAAMRLEGGSLQASLSEYVTERCGVPIEVRLMHDGTAAATVYPGETVITLGTSIGVGMAAAVEEPIPLAAGFAVQKAY